MDSVLRLDADGYFIRGTQRIVPVGVNYWPASTGVDMWARWNPDEIQHDIDLVASLGLNCIRFFLRWQDFEPEPGLYNPEAFKHLDQFMGWIVQRHLLVQPSLFVGSMSGGVFWPAWKQNRNLFTDPFMLERSQSFARRVAQALAPFQEHLAGFDYGNEMEGLPDSKSLTLAELRTWTHAVKTAVLAEIPRALFVPGTSPGPLVGETAWRYDNDLGADFLSVHPYPIPYWQGLRFDGLRDPFAQAFFPYAIKAARINGPVMVQEFATLITGAAAPQDAYLRSVLPAGWNAGANGFLWWCLRDVKSRAYNYVRAGMESRLGLVDAQDRVKPGLEFFLEFARDVQTRPLPDRRSEIALYWPRHYHQQEDPGHTHNSPQTLHNRMLCAYHLLVRTGRNPSVVRGVVPLPPHLQVLIITGAHLDADEVVMLTDWVRAGGKLIWHGPRWSEWGNDMVKLLGASPADFRLPQNATVEAFGRSWNFASHHTPENARMDISPSGAEPLAADSTGFPILWRHNLGKGCVLFTIPVIEEAVLSALGDLAARDAWSDWYAGELALLQTHDDRFAKRSN